VDDVVILKNWLAKDEKFVLVWGDEKHTNRHIALLRNIDYVVLWLQLEPVASKHPK
jgi:hypothetical protein